MSVELTGPNVPSDAIIIRTINPDELAFPDEILNDRQKNWVAAQGFKAKSGEVLVLPGEDGGVESVLFGAPDWSKQQPELVHGNLVNALGEGTYYFQIEPGNAVISYAALIMAGYNFTRYREASNDKIITFVVQDDTVREAAQKIASANALVRDLVNTPTNDLGPEHLAQIAHDLAAQNGGVFSEIVGDDLLEKNFPLIHAVGRACDRAPRLIDFTWGDDAAPKVTLVGKGVCFDTGGLNIKPGNSMALMKKDMGGAANVLGLAQMIMEANLPVRLRVLIPAVENSISGNAFRPGDILPSRAGISVEISNTDAEGRLVLADALTYGDEEEPEIMIDMATLTGAARVALGPDLPPFYTNDDLFAEELMVRSKDMADPVWRMPLWEPYQSMLDTPIADVNHASAGGFAGSITAALFLARFVKKAALWSHFDVFAWTPSDKPARPKGGEAQAIRAIFAVLKARYS